MGIVKEIEKLASDDVYFRGYPITNESGKQK